MLSCLSVTLRRTPDPKVSAGARLERAAFRAYLRRLLKHQDSPSLQSALAWVLKRQARYDRKAGGLGK
jgi:hypothetical protein